MTTTASRRHLAVLAAAVLTAAAGLVGLSSSPAAAALCSGNGVNVVVDFNGLGGGVQKGCDPNGANRTADKVFPAAGFSLKYAQRQPGFVCRINGTPGSDPCVNTAPANAYWGLFWSDGKSGKWSYASAGAGGLKVPSGGFVAFSWQGSQAKDPPSTTPKNSQPAPKPTPKPTPAPTPTKKPTAKPTTKPGKGGTKPTKTGGTAVTPTAAATTAAAKAATKAGASATSAPTATASSTPAASAGASESPSAEATPTDESTPATASQKVNSSFEPDEEHSGLPTWVPVVVIVGLAGGAGGALWWRRRTGAA